MNNFDIGRCKRIVQYLWDPEPRNDDDPNTLIWCLGRVYTSDDQTANSEENESKNDNRNTEHTIASPQRNLESSVHTPSADESITGEQPPEQMTIDDKTVTRGWPSAFLSDFESKFWMTYRSNFIPIPKIDKQDGGSSMTLGVRLRSQFMDPNGFTSDTGWGCMIRSGQSLLANTLSILILGRDWRRGHKPEEEMQLISLFADSPDAPFSIHRFVQHGAESCGKYPGEWFGPSATARCIQALSSQCEHPKLRVYITNDSSDVYQDRFMDIACDDSGQINPTLILLGIRLGIDHVTPVYWDGLKTALQYPQSIGVAGGRPSASHYFVGVQGSYLFYLDPHYTRPALPYERPDRIYSEEELETYHTRRLRRIHIKDMDPSMLIGFLIRDEQDWVDWKRRVKAAQGKAVVHIIGSEMQPEYGTGREEALDEVEALDDDGLE